MGGTITHKQALATGIIGAIVLLLLWYLVTMSGEIIRPQILPNPINVYGRTKLAGEDAVKKYCNKED